MLSRSIPHTPSLRQDLFQSATQGLADAVFLDLEASVAEPEKGAAPANIIESLFRRRAKKPYDGVYVNELESSLINDDLNKFVPHTADSILLPQSRCTVGAKHIISARDAFSNYKGSVRLLVALDD